MDELFFSPGALGMTGILKGDDGSEIVRLEQLLWVLDGPLLCEAITGVVWSKYVEILEDDKSKELAFQRQTQLARFFGGQISLFAKLCMGRSYNCIAWMEQAYPYSMLVSMCQSPYVPHIFRAACCDLVKSLYLDRYPQLVNCGRPALPEQLWVYEVVRKDVDLTTMPVIRDLSLSKPGSLLEFKIPPSHRLANDPDPMLSFNNGLKFFLLRKLTNDFVGNFGSGALVYSQKNLNLLAGSVTGLISSLLQFGFQSTHEKIKGLLSCLVLLLDGRVDFEGYDPDHGVPVPFEPPSARYELTSNSSTVTDIKSSVISVLMGVADLRASFRLAKLLHIFKSYLDPKGSDHAMGTQLLKHHHCLEIGEQYTGDLHEKLSRDFESLFIEGDGLALDLGKLSGRDIDTVLLDCLMYEDDKLFAAALALLDRTFGQRRTLIKAIGQVILLHQSSIPVFDNVASMIADLGYLMFLLRSSEVWGVSSKISGDFDDEKYSQCLDCFDKLKTYLYAQSSRKRDIKVAGPLTRGNSTNQMLSNSGRRILPDPVETKYEVSDSTVNKNEVPGHSTAGDDGPNEQHQNILRALSLHSALIAGLNINYNISFEAISSPENKIKSRNNLLDCLRSNVDVLVDFVRGNSENQLIVFKQLPRLKKLLGKLSLPDWPKDFPEDLKGQVRQEPKLDADGVIIECLRNNEYLCAEKIPRSLFEIFGQLLEQEADPSTSPLLQFFEIGCVPLELAQYRNQQSTIEVLLSDRLPRVKACVQSIVGIGELCVAPERICQLLSKTIAQGNATVAGVLQAGVITMEAVLTTLSTRVVEVYKKAEMLSGEASLVGAVRTMLLEDEYAKALIYFVSLQLSVLVIDPKLYRRDIIWIILEMGLGPILRGYLSLDKGPQKQLQHMASAALTVARIIIRGAQEAGLRDRIEKHIDVIKEDTEASILQSCEDIYKLDYLDEEIMQVAKKAAATISPELSLDQAEITNADGNVAFRPGASWPSDERGPTYASDPMSALGYFNQALNANPYIQSLLLKRRFAFVELLENAGERTDPKLNKRRNQPILLARVVDARVKITWDDIVVRMVKYVQAHNFDEDETTRIRIFNVLRNHLVKARSIDGEEEQPGNLEEEQFREYYRKQSGLNRQGVTEAVLQAIAMHRHGGDLTAEGTLGDEAIELLMEMLNAGNADVQRQVFEYITHVDRDGKIFAYFKARMLVSLERIKDRKLKVKDRFVKCSAETKEEFENAMQTFELLQELCEGHNLAVQDLLREQPSHSGNINLITIVIDTLGAMCDSGSALRKMDQCEIDLLNANLDLLIEVVQGPCLGNQLEIVNSDVLGAIKNVLPSPFHKRITKRNRMLVKNRAILLVSSLLEGRNDKVAHAKLACNLEAEMLDNFCDSVYKYIEAVRQDHNTSFEEQEEAAAEATECLVSLKSVYNDLKLVKSFADQERKFDDNERLKDRVGQVEISWHGHIESVSFPLPADIEYLGEQTKEAFLMRCDLSTAESRMKELIVATPIFIAEMGQIYRLARMSNFYGWYHQNLLSIKFLMYALVVLLNINIAMASYGQLGGGYSDDHNVTRSGEYDGNPFNANKGYNSAIDFGVLKGPWNYSVVLTYVFGIINFLGYVTIVGFLGVTEIPIITRQVDEKVRNDLQTIREYRDPGAFNAWGVTLMFNIFFILMHKANYPHLDATGLYLFLVLGINLPWTVYCCRQYVVVPNTPHTRRFAIVYDLAVGRPFFRNHVLLMMWSVQGFLNSSYFTLMLLDIINNSDMLADIIRSIVRPLPALGMIFYTFIITVIIFATFGLENFEEHFVYDEYFGDEEAVGCHNVVSCSWLIFYKGVPAGDLGEVMDSVDRTSPSFLWRLLFDLCFFIWVGVLLFNIITGLMLDTFAELREEAATRNDIMTNQCFVCGLTRAAYDDLYITSPSFDEHKGQEHDLWKYVYFLSYLRSKDQTEYSGVETYVAEMLERQDLSFVPSRTSLVIQNRKIGIGDEGDIEGHIGEMIDLAVGSITKTISSLTASITEVTARLDDPESQPKVVR